MTREYVNLFVENSSWCDDKLSSEMFNLIPIHESEEYEDSDLTTDGSSTYDTIRIENFNLFSAVNNKDSEWVKSALKDGADVNARSGIMRITVLHIASSLGDENILQILLRAGADANAADKLGSTPLHMAAKGGHDVCLKTLLGVGANPNVAFQVSTLQNKDGQHKRKMIESGEIGTTISLDTLGLNLPLPECWGRTPLHQAVKGNHPKCARILLEAGAEVDSKDECGITPLLLAGMNIRDHDQISKYEDIINILLDYSANCNVFNESTGETPLHRAVSLYSVNATKILLKHGADLTACLEIGNNRTPIHLAAMKAASDILSLMLDSEPDESAKQKLANVIDGKGRTPLHLAAYSGCHHCVSALMKAGADLGATTSNGISALDELLLYLPRPALCLGRIFDSRVRPNSATVDERSFAVQLDFRPLAPHGTERQTGVMRALLEAEAATDETRRMLLTHPLVEAFIVLKWRRLRLFFYLLVGVYLAFAVSLSAYVTLLHCEIERSPVILDSIIVSRRVLLFSASVVMLNVFGQFVALPKYYVKQFEMWMNLITAVLAIIVAIESNYDGSPNGNPHNINAGVIIGRIGNETELENRLKYGNQLEMKSYTWILHMTAVVILFSWVELMLLIGRFPTWGSHALLYYAVLKNVLKVLLAFGCLIMGFSFSFFVQFHKVDPDAFGDPWRAFVKTMIMMMGEFEYEDLFTSKKWEGDGKNEVVDKDSIATLHITSRIIFVSFVILASIVLVNLMVGLAVSDTQALRSEGEARRLLKQAEFVSHLERGVSAVVSSKWLPKFVLASLLKRRSVPTVVTVRPSDAANAPAHSASHHLSRHLLDELVTLALRKRANERMSYACHPNESSNLTFGMGDPHNAELLQAIENITRDLSEIKETLEIKQREDVWSPLRLRKWSSTKTPKARFSDLVSEVSGAQNILRRLSRKEGMLKISDP